MRLSVLFLLTSIFLFSCNHPTEQAKSENPNLLKYALQIQMTESKDSVFIQSGNEELRFSKNKLPLKTAMVIPTSAISYLDELGLIAVIKGISQPDFVFNPKVIELFNQKKIEQIGSFDEIFVEKILLNKPDIFITSSGPTLAKFHQQIKNAGIKILYIDEYDEKEPLARAEYVKIFGKLFGKEKEADEIFEEIEKNYNEIVSSVEKSDNKKPKVFANQIYGDVWYMPGGKSFQARLFKDAGGSYVWSDDDSESSLKLSFEKIFEKAANADFWLNAGDYKDLESLLETYKNYEWFTAAKNKNIYNWNKKSNVKGANDYFETGTVRPDLVLKDLASIFYPDLYPEHELYFYDRLK